MAEFLRLVSASRVEAILTAVDRGEADKVVGQMEELEGEGVEVVSLISKLLLALQVRLRKGVENQEGWSRSTVRLTRKLVKVVPRVKISPLPLLPLEMVLVEAALRNQKTGIRNQDTNGVVEVVMAKELPAERKTKMDFDQVVSGWPELLARLQPRNHSVAGLLRSAKPKELMDKFLTIEVFYKFHKDQLEQEARRRIIEEEIAKLWGPISVRCVLGDPPSRKASDGQGRVVAVVNNEDIVKNAEEIFGV